MTKRAAGGSKRVKPAVGLAPQPTWALLQTEWLDIPIGTDSRSAHVTWEAFSEAFEICLRGVSDHVARHVDEHARLGDVVTEALVGNLDVLVSHLGHRAKLQRLLEASDRLLERGRSPRPASD